MRARRPSSPCVPAPRRVALLFSTPGRLDFLQRGRRGGQAGDRDAEGGATDVAQAETMAELHARRFAPVLAANAQLDAGAALAAQGAGHLHEFADAGLVDAREWILLYDLQFG